MDPDELPPVQSPFAKGPTPLSPGKIRIQLLSIFLNVKVKRPYVIIRLGDQRYQSTISEFKDGRWNECFEFNVTFHAQMFGTIQMDLYDNFTLYPDKHVGRTEIRLSTLESMPETFMNYYEIWDKKLSTGASSSIGRERAGVNNVGALHVKISYRYLNPHDMVTNSMGGLRAAYTAPEGSTNLLTEEQLSEEFKRHLQFHRQRERVGGIKFRKYEGGYEEESSPDDSDVDDTTGSLMQPRKKKPVTVDNDDDDFGDMVSAKDDDKGWSGLPDTSASAVIKSIGKLLATFNQGFELSNMQVLTGFNVLEKFYQDMPRNRTWDIVQDLSEIDMGSRFWKFAIASYGWKGLNFIGKGNGIFSDAMREHSDAKSIIEYLGIPKVDLLAYEFRSAEAFRPSYFIARDRFTNSIVLSIRGTMSVMDTLTDLVCEYEPWRGGFIHSGMKNSAMWFFRHVAPQLVAYSNEHSTTGLVIVGHSLGAATAAILTMILNDYMDEFRQDKEDFSLRCYCYAPACGLSLDLAESCKDMVQSFVFADDIVSKLSYGSMMDVKELIIASSEACRDMGITEILWADNLEDNKWKNAFQRIAEVRQRCYKEMENPRLYVAGQIYQFWLDPTPSNDTRIVVEKTNAKKVCEEVIVKRSILLDHLPTNFDVAFRRARETLMMEGKGALQNKRRPSADGVLDPVPSEQQTEDQDGDKEALADGEHPIWSAVAKLGLKGTTDRTGGDGKVMGDDVSRN